jgi:hypothetical protein
MASHRVRPEPTIGPAHRVRPEPTIGPAHRVRPLAGPMAGSGRTRWAGPMVNSAKPTVGRALMGLAFRSTHPTSLRGGDGGAEND